MNPIEELLRDEIRRNGPISFHRFMDAALYHPEHGYYRRPRDPFGRHGDFYTAEQIQPVFGILIAARIRQLYREMGSPTGFTVVELGAGRQEMAEALSEWRYLPIERGADELPEGFCGVVFSNEFFDALPVEVVVFEAGQFHEFRVGVHSEGFGWVRGDRARPEIEEYLRRYLPPAAEGNVFEVNLDALGWLERIARVLEAGYVFTIDYGYTRAEAVRFPRGTLMTYHRHSAREDALAEPGGRDITAHVCFTALEERGAELGLERVRFESLAQTLLAAGEADQFAAALAGPAPVEQLRRRMQLKQLLFGMGETFRTLIQRKA